MLVPFGTICRIVTTIEAKKIQFNISKNQKLLINFKSYRVLQFKINYPIAYQYSTSAWSPDAHKRMQINLLCRRKVLLWSLSFVRRTMMMMITITECEASFRASNRGNWRTLKGMTRARAHEWYMTLRFRCVRLSHFNSLQQIVTAKQMLLFKYNASEINHTFIH